MSKPTTKLDFTGLISLLHKDWHALSDGEVRKLLAHRRELREHLEHLCAEFPYRYEALERYRARNVKDPFR